MSSSNPPKVLPLGRRTAGAERPLRRERGLALQWRSSKSKFWYDLFNFDQDTLKLHSGTHGGLLNQVKRISRICKSLTKLWISICQRSWRGEGLATLMSLELMKELEYLNNSFSTWFSRPPRVPECNFKVFWSKLNKSYKNLLFDYPHGQSFHGLSRGYVLASHGSLEHGRAIPRPVLESLENELSYELRWSKMH